MAELKADVLVLGAGMVGVSAALHLQQRGRDVILVDVARALLPRVLTGSRAAQRDGRIAFDPAQPDRA